MAVQIKTGSALSLGRLGLALGNGHAYAATGSIFVLSLGTALMITAGILLVVGLTNLGTSDKKKPKADQTKEKLQ